MAEQLVIIDYGSGNLRSVAKALQRAADDAALPMELILTADADVVRRADRIVLPGVGAFKQCATALRQTPGIWDALQQRVLNEAAPFLGICVGMQLLATHGLEYGAHDGLDWIKGEVVKMSPPDAALKIPHMGWNIVHFRQHHAVLENLPDTARAYFVHSYHFTCARRADVLAETEYGNSLAAIIGRDNMIGTQFHPEKSQGYGLAFLSAFLKWKP